MYLAKALRVIVGHSGKDFRKVRTLDRALVLLEAA